MPKTALERISYLVLAFAGFSFAIVYVTLGAIWLDIEFIIEWFSIAESNGFALLTFPILLFSIPLASASGTLTIIAGAIHLRRKKNGSEGRLAFILFGISTLLFSLISIPAFFLLVALSRN